MLGGKNVKKPLGYTIVEVMIVLAVSGVMFLIAASFINGKEEKTAFTAGVNDMASNIQDVIEQVTDGRYSDIPLNCTVTAEVKAGEAITDGSTNVSQDSNGTSLKQGTNSGCVFLGKILYLNNGKPSDYLTFSVAGQRLADSMSATLGLNDAIPNVVDALTTEQTTPQQLQVIKVTETDLYGVAQTSWAIGFFESRGTGGGDAIARQGANAAYLYFINGPTGTAYNSGGIYSSGPKLAQFLTMAQTADICLTDGSQYADITLGTGTAGASNTGGQLTANVKMDGTTSCAT